MKHQLRPHTNQSHTNEITNDQMTGWPGTDKHRMHIEKSDLQNQNQHARPLTRRLLGEAWSSEKGTLNEMMKDPIDWV